MLLHVPFYTSHLWKMRRKAMASLHAHAKSETELVPPEASMHCNSVAFQSYLAWDHTVEQLRLRTFSRKPSERSVFKPVGIDLKGSRSSPLAEHLLRTENGRKKLLPN